MYRGDKLRKKAAKATNKKALIGSDIDLGEFEKDPVHHDYLSEEDLQTLPDEEQQQLLMSGLDITGKDRGGTFFQKDTTVIHCTSKQEGIEVIPIRKALEEYTTDAVLSKM